MKTAELIKQAEELLGKTKNGAFDLSDDVKFEDKHISTASFLLTAADVRFGIFAHNHMQELIDKLRKCEEALNNILGWQSLAPADVIVSARKAVEEE